MLMISATLSSECYVCVEKICFKGIECAKSAAKYKFLSKGILAYS